MPKTSRRLTVHPLTLREVEVVGVTDLTPGMRRITLGGEQLRAFTSANGFPQPAFARAAGILSTERRAPENRWALAQVQLADPDLAIFDEATAEAGSLQADLLDRAATAVLAGRTALVIAHRLSQAAECDRIVVMDRGRIVETGTHDGLVGAGGAYAALWTAWLEAISTGRERET